MNYIIDGTNVSITLSQSKKTTLLPLFQVMLAIFREGESCICYFDHKTKFHAPFENWLFNRITVGRIDSNPWVTNGIFRITPPTNKKGEPMVADDEILQTASEKYPLAKVLSFDNYKEYAEQKKYNWSTKDSVERVLTIYPHQDKIQLMLGESSLFKEFDMPQGKFEEVATELINLIEERNGRLIGRISDLNSKRQVGKIKRRYSNGSLISFTPKGHDPAFNFAQSRGQEVRFNLRFNISKQKKNGKPAFYLNATHIKPIESIELENQVLWEENKRLQAEIEALRQKQTEVINENEEMKGNLATEQEEKSSLYLQIEALEEEIKFLKEQLAKLEKQSKEINEDEELLEKTELQEVILELRQDFEQLLDLYNKQRVKIEFLRKPGDGRYDLLLVLEKAQLALDTYKLENERLAQKIEELEASISHIKTTGSTHRTEKTQDTEPVPGSVTDPGPIVDPAPAINSDALLNWWHALSNNWKKAFSESNGIKDEIPSTKTLQQLISKKKIKLIGQDLPMNFDKLTITLQELSGLAELTNLQSVNLSYNAITDLTPLANLPDLESIVLVENQGLTSLKGLEALTKLSYVNIRGTSVSDEEIARFKAQSKSVRNMEIEK